MFYLLKIFLLSLVPSIYNDNIDEIRKEYGITSYDSDEQDKKEKEALELDGKDKPNAGESGEDKNNDKDKKNGSDKDTENKDDKEQGKDGDKKTDDKDTDKKNDKENNDDEPEPVFVINKVEFTRSQLVEKATEHFGFDISKVGDEDAVNKLILSYVDSSNIDEGKKIVNQRHQDNAKDKKEIERKQKELDDKEKELEKREKELEDLLKKDPDDEIDVVAKAKLSMKQENASEELEDLKRQKEEIQIEARGNILSGWLNELTEELPHLKLSRDIADIVADFNENIVKDPSETAIALDIVSALGNYEFEKKNNKTKVSFVNYFKVKYPSLAVSSKSSTEKKNDETDSKDKKNKSKQPTKIDLTALTSEERLKRLKERQNNALPDPKESQKETHSTENDKSSGKKPTLKSLGYV